MLNISNLENILLSIICPLLVIVFAPLYLGLISKFRGLIEGRASTRLLQPYYDLQKLFSKEVIIPKNSSWVFKFSPYVLLTIIIVIALISPSLTTVSAFAEYSDLVFFFSLFMLMSFLGILAAVDSGTAFGGIGASREAFLLSLIEPSILMIIMSLGIEFNSSNLYQIVIKNIDEKSFLNHPNMIFTAFAFLIVILIECKRFPVDNPSTHLELTMIHEAMILEYSGKYLAIIEYCSALKITILSTLFLSIFYPIGITSSMDITNLSIALGFWVAKMLCFAFVIALYEKSTAKLRVFRIPELVSFSLAMAVISIFAHYFIKV